MVGPGGCGKTRLAIEVGRSVTDHRPDGVFFVDLSGLSDPGLVPGAVLRALGLRAAPGRDPVGVLVTQLSERDVLLVLDNCEHLVDACASLADALVRGCPRIWVLATSRERLGVTGEVIVPVGGLELPDRDQRGREDWLENSEAGRLFIDRAMKARPGFVLDDSGVAAVAQICERLDGIPLALELAAARARLMSVHAIAEGLSDRFRLLVGSERAGPPRQRTLLASIEWSCALLKEDERALLRRLSVFASGFTLAAAEAVCAGGEIGAHDVLGAVDLAGGQVPGPGGPRCRPLPAPRDHARLCRRCPRSRRRHRSRPGPPPRLLHRPGPGHAAEVRHQRARCRPGAPSSPTWTTCAPPSIGASSPAQFDAAAELLGGAGPFLCSPRALAGGLGPLRAAAGGRAGTVAAGRTLDLSRSMYRRNSDPSASLRPGQRSWPR